MDNFVSICEVFGVLMHMNMIKMWGVM